MEPLDITNALGLVVALQANYLEVEIDLPESILIEKNLNKKDFPSHQRFLCTRRRRLKHIKTFVNVGDRVSLEAIDWRAKTAVVSEVKPRSSWLSRPPVANLTKVVVIISLKQPSLDVDQLSRFLIAIEQTGVDMLLVLSKQDLLSSIELQEYIKQFASWGYKSCAVSNKNGYGLEPLRKVLHSTDLSVLCGPSGVGKSSLINQLLPHESVTVGGLSSKLQRGCHTTRNIQLYSLNSTSFVADTPGFNRPEIEINPTQLAYLFPEMREILSKCSCRFSNCVHREEDGCVIPKDLDRYPFYLKMLDEMLTSQYPSRGV